MSHDFSKIADVEAPRWVAVFEKMEDVTVSVEGTTIKIARTVPQEVAMKRKDFINVWAVDWNYDCWINAYSGAPIGNPDHPNAHAAFAIIEAVVGFRGVMELC